MLYTLGFSTCELREHCRLDVVYLTRTMSGGLSNSASGRTSLGEVVRKPCSACHHPRPANAPVAVAISSGAQLQGSSQRGCTVCRLFLAAIATVLGEEPYPSGNDRLRLEFNIAPPGRSLYIYSFARQLKIALYVEQCPRP